MKQKIAMMIVGSVFVLSFALAGCGSEQQTSSETESTSADSLLPVLHLVLHPAPILPRKLPIPCRRQLRSPFPKVLHGT